MSLLMMENVVKEYGNRTLLNGVSLRVERGERVALIGPNGSGKSTLLKIAMGMEECDSGRVILARDSRCAYLSQSISEVKGEENFNHTALYYEKVIMLEMKLREIEDSMAQLSPDRMGEMEELMKEYARLTSMYEAADGYNTEIKIKKILLGLGLKEETLTIPSSSLSGGEKMRAAIARMILEEPGLLILDEPTNHLDIQAIEWLEDFLKKFEGGVVVVSHDRYFLDHVATRIAELQDGTITERSGNYSIYMEQKKKMRDFMLREEKRLEIQMRNDREVVEKFKSMRKIKAFKSREAMGKRKGEELKASINSMKTSQHLYKANAPKISFKKIDHVSKDIVEVKNLVKGFEALSLFKGACFEIGGGERVGIVGPNGCGKTTLINIITGLDTDFKGSVRLGEWVKYSYMGQEISFEYENRTVLEEIIVKKEMTVPEALKYLARFQFFGDEASKPISVLSGGERVRLYLARIMLEEASCLIMDEPTNHLDVPAREALESALLEFKGTVIAVTHDRYFLNNCVSRILEIENGKINSYRGNYEDYRRAKFGDINPAVEEKEAINSSKKPLLKGTGMGKADGTVKVDASKIEAQIMMLEKAAREMADSFGKDTPPEKYNEYNSILNEIEKMYTIWGGSS